MDELPQAPAVTIEAIPRDEKKRFVPGNNAAQKLSRVRVSKGGRISKLEAKASAERKLALKYGRQYTDQRVREFTRTFGQVSSGVGSMLVSAGQLMGDARYFHALGLGLPDHPTRGSMTSADCAKIYANLLCQARSCERDAWELAVRETKARIVQEGGGQQVQNLAKALTASKISEGPGGS
jgi:hypothetical protein